MEPATTSALPCKTSRYNVGCIPVRFRSDNGRAERHPLKSTATVYDGAGRVVTITSGSVWINQGAVKELDIDHDGVKEPMLWAWRAGKYSGWIQTQAFRNPPKIVADPDRNPPAPAESTSPLRISTSEANRLLRKLHFLNSRNEIPEDGNRGEHYAGRNVRCKTRNCDYIYLLFAVPNVKWGGAARDSLPDGSNFYVGLDDNGKSIVETMTMYRNRDLGQPVKVSFVYGHGEGETQWGWIARAALGEL